MEEYRLNIQRKDVGTRPSYPRQIEDFKPILFESIIKMESHQVQAFLFSKRVRRRKNKGSVSNKREGRLT
jgi:hypothetical protein